MALTAETVLKGIAITMGAIAVMMAAIDVQSAFEESVIVPDSAEIDPLKDQLQDCRALAPKDLETDTACQAAWDENRRRFFGVED